MGWDSKKITWITVILLFFIVYFVVVVILKSKQSRLTDGSDKIDIIENFDSEPQGFMQEGVVKIGRIYSDDMESTKGWVVGGESGTSSLLNNVPGKVGKAIEIEYEFRTGQWIQMQKRVYPLNIEGAKKLEFYYNGTGSINTLQVKLEDADGTTFGINLNGATNTEGLWEQLILSIDELQYFWGEDENLDKDKIKKIFFAITSEEGGKGRVAIDEVVLLE